VSLYINLKPTGKFEYLKTVKIKALFEETKTRLLFHGCPSLEELQVKNVYYINLPLILNKRHNSNITILKIYRYNLTKWILNIGRIFLSLHHQ